jgi:hypothetical protein
MTAKTGWRQLNRLGVGRGATVKIVHSGPSVPRKRGASNDVTKVPAPAEKADRQLKKGARSWTSSHSANDLVDLWWWWRWPNDVPKWQLVGSS